jgi:formate-dependent nitrite reductase membrane component NrfD
MNPAPSSTWFAAPPDWGWLITLYFFIGGLAGGSYFLATLIDVFGRADDRPLARLGYYVAFPCVLVSGALLTLDLGRPLRFWHMLIESNTYRPMFKYWSPMSIGSWALLIFGLFALVSFLGALAIDDRLQQPALRRLGARWPRLRQLGAMSSAGRVISAIGSILGLYVAGYTGVLLAVTNRPIWSDTPLLGMLFVVSATSTSAALMALLAHRFRRITPGVADLQRMEAWVVALEFVVLLAVLVSLGPILVAWLNAWGALLAIAVVLGLIAPLVLAWRARRVGEGSMATAASLVLLGGFLLRVVVVFSAQAV